MKLTTRLTMKIEGCLYLHIQQTLCVMCSFFFHIQSLWRLAQKLLIMSKLSVPYIVLLCSHIIVLCWETGIHTGSSGCGDAAFNGAEPIANITYAHSDTVPLSLSTAHRFCHEHPTEANNETGNMSQIKLFDVPVCMYTR